MKILIVEDEQDLRETIRASLLKEKFVVETAADYFSALDKINDYDYDCILLEWDLAGTLFICIAFGYNHSYRVFYTLKN